MKLISLLSICIIAFACEKVKTCDCVMPYQVYYLKARVAQTQDISCYKPVLDFAEDSLRIRALTNKEDLLYSVINLPENYIVKDKQLYVEVIALKTSEEFACNTLGIALPHLNVTDARERE